MESSRFLRPEEVETLLNLSLSSDSRWRILIATRDNDFCTSVADLFSDDEQVWIDRVTTGCDALISCTRHTPDLLVLDSELTDMHSRFLIEAIRRDKELASLRILCRLNSDIFPNQTEGLANDFIQGEEDLEKVYLSRKLHTLLYATHSQPETTYRGPCERRWPRARLRMSARIGMCRPDGLGPEATGEAMLENISFGGAYLSGIKLERASVIPGASRLMLNINQPDLPDFSADSVMLRYRPNGSAGVQFLNVSKDNRLKLLELFDK